MAGDIVLLTGATGFIGFRTLVLLLEAGYAVRTAVRTAADFDRIKSIKSVAAYTSKLEFVVVADITLPGAYDEAVKGVDYVVHMASPFASSEVQNADDHETAYIQPAVNGTIGMLDSASKVPSIERVVITGSILSIKSFGAADGSTIIDEGHRSAKIKGPYANWAAAYAASKVRAFDATKQWCKEHNPSFNVINILPVFVLGRDETLTDASALLKGSNNVLLSPLLGNPAAGVYPGIPVHVDDVAELHVRSLDRSVPGNQDYIACSHSLQGVEWAQSFDIVKKHFPKECEAGIFKLNTTERPQTTKLLVDASKAENTFGITFKSFEEQVLSIVGQYVELLGRK
ncbi:hypothetical protein H2200_000354 [Cladophialophora chaetospira]|uniref:NAD-dependent epimerase/dehydratase domain-containing protein n=1 Tax=Cladophialophora chaetospira TaxID=386627 RepID=A0AA38XN98_9EURO|nr:hypothetical protein H2200_000354 [Cladophialophora chaetospira]